MAISNSGKPHECGKIICTVELERNNQFRFHLMIMTTLLALSSPLSTSCFKVSRYTVAVSRLTDTYNCSKDRAVGLTKNGGVSTENSLKT